MLRFELSVEILGHTRFVYSPLAEVAGSLHLLGLPSAPGLHRRWVHEAADRLAGTDIALLRTLYPVGRWAPDFLFVPASSPSTSIEDQLHDLVRTPVDAIASDLQLIWGEQRRGLPGPARTMLEQGQDGVNRLVDQLQEYWRLAVKPFWPRISAVLEEDVAHHASRLMAGGLFGLLSDVHPEVSAVDGVLLVDKPHHPDALHRSDRLTLVPSVFGHPHLVAAHDAGQITLTYGARGVARVWETRENETPVDRLGALLGRTRAGVLRRLAVPASTTQLSRELRQSPATISEHLSVLREAGMVSSWRSGRQVLYRQTALGATVVDATTLEEAGVV